MKQSSFKQKPCPECGSLFHAAWYHKPRKAMVTTKRLKPIGKQGQRYKVFRDTVAYPYLVRTFGEKCANCGRTDVPLDVDHKLKRGSHAELKYELTNLQLLCRPCHNRKDNTLEGL